MINFKKMEKRPKSQYGQGTSEYINIVSLVAVASITAVSIFGASNRAQVAAIANEMAGNNQAATASMQQAQDSAGAYVFYAGLNNYGGNSSAEGRGGSGGSGSGNSSAEGVDGAGGSGGGSAGTGHSGYDNASAVVVSAAPFGQIATQSAVSSTPAVGTTLPAGNTYAPSIVAADTTETYKGLTLITKAGANNTKVKSSIDLLPSKVLATLVEGKVKIVAVKDNMTEYFPNLTGTPRGYTGGVDFTTAQGGYVGGSIKTAVIGTIGNRSPSVNVTLHEIGHAYDHLTGFPSRKSDFTPTKRISFVRRPYYNQPGNAGLSESYAESFARYISKTTKHGVAKNYWDKQNWNEK